MDRPNCQCGHSYPGHGWGTTFCNDPNCECNQFKESLCPCGHIWGIHGFTEKREELVCPECGILCQNWRKPLDNKSSVEVWEKSLAGQPDPKPAVQKKPVQKEAVQILDIPLDS